MSYKRAATKPASRNSGEIEVQTSRLNPVEHKSVGLYHLVAVSSWPMLKCVAGS